MTLSRIFLFAALGLTLFGCKTKDVAPDTGDTDSGTEDSDSVEDSDTSVDDSDSDSDSDSGEETDTGTEEQCWVASDNGECFDTTVCDLPASADEAEEGNLAFLNQCSDVDSAVFDNAARIPASTWTPGDPLPEP